MPWEECRFLFLAFAHTHRFCIDRTIESLNLGFSCSVGTELCEYSKMNSLSQICAKVGNIGAAFYFHPDTIAVGKANGLDGFRFYVLGRGGVLGDVESPVVSSAFAWWNPAVIEKMWASGRAVLSPRDAGRLYMTCAHGLGTSKFSGISGLAEFCASAEKVAASIDDAGLALYAGVAAEPLPDDLAARAMQHVVALREYRGSVHILAAVASGISPRVAHFIRRPDMYKSFGWDDSNPPTVTDADHAALAAADALTDRLVEPVYGVLSADEAAHFLATLTAMEAALAG
jgi:hypothetical protein